MKPGQKVNAREPVDAIAAAAKMHSSSRILL
jgi:hypothetical protein